MHQRRPTYGSLLRCSALLGLLLLGFACQPGRTPQPHATQKQAIINGTPDLKHPAVGAILHKGVSFCTGTLITRQLVLTAAHCISSALQRGSQDVQFRIDFPDPQMAYRSELYNVQSLHAHPSYKGGSNGYEYDLGVLVLTQKVTTTSPLPILQTAMPNTWIGKKIRLEGYGLIQTRPVKRADHKYTADIPVLQIDPRSFIHIDTVTKKSACHGDSGGPALYQVDGRLHVVGVTSVAYKASPAPTPGLTYCDGGAISTRVDTHITNFLQRFLTLYTDAPKACNTDASCAPCGTCQQQICQPTPVATEPTNCRPCRDDNDCGKGKCHRFKNGYRCLQPCAGQSSRCCPSGQYCSSTFTNSNDAFCIPAQHSCPPVSCQQKSECGLGEACIDNTCEPQRPTPTPQLCKPCYTSAQCGKNGFCHNSLSSLGYCVQRCAIGKFCAKDSTCRTLGPGLDLCIPNKQCFANCDANAPCHNDYQCLRGQCIRTGGGKDGDSCTDQRKCHNDYQCLPTGREQPKQCAKRCGAPEGSAGSPCPNGRCATGLQCLSINGNTRVCLETCKNTCAGGGQCYEFGASLSVCLCQDDADCDGNQTCNYSGLSDFGVGACTTTSQGPPPCRPGLQCSANPPYGHFCQPAQGDRRIGQTCSFLQRCAKGLICHQLNDFDPPVCLESCSTQQTCKQGGRCLTTQQGQGLCLCTNENKCSKGKSCHFAGHSPSVGEVGYCKRTGSFKCQTSDDCPVEHTCDPKKGSCAFDPKKQNKPFPKEHPQENIKEPSTEPLKEKTPEPDTMDAASQEQNSEPPQEPNTPDTTTKTEPNRDNPVSDRGDTTTLPEPTIGDESPQKTSGCDCQQTPKTPNIIALIGFLLLLLPSWQKHRLRRPKTSQNNRS